MAERPELTQQHGVKLLRNNAWLAAYRNALELTQRLNDSLHRAIRQSVAVFATHDAESAARPSVAAQIASAPSPTPISLASPSSSPSGITRGPIAHHTNRPPIYPQDALNRITGTVKLHLIIDPQGNIAAVSIINSSNTASLDQAALDAAKAWRFQPALENNQPVQCEIDLPVNFILKN